MRILHSYCLNYNIGDYALGMGVKNLFRQNFDVDYFGETNLQGQTFSKYYIEEVINKRYDLLVIGGGGIIHGKHWPNGWFWLVEQDLIKEIKIPFVIFSVGNNFFPEEEEIPSRGIAHLQETYKHAKYFSVRNDGSYDRTVNQLGFEPYIQPDPGFHIPKRNLGAKIDKPYIIVQLAADKLLSRFGSNDKITSFVQAMQNQLSLISKNYHILFVPHVFDDVALSKTIMEKVTNSSILPFSEFAFDRSAEVIDYYQYAEFVIAMRGHGQIIPIGFEVPVIALYNHPKHQGLMEELDLADYGVDISTTTFESNLNSKISNLMALQTRELYIDKLHNIRKSLDIQTQNAMEGLKKSIQQ